MPRPSAATQTDGPSLLLTPKRAPRSTTTTARRKSPIAAERTLPVESSSPILITVQPPMETIMSLDIHPMPYTQPPKSGQFTFLSTSSSEPLYERRGPRTRTVQPVPVPNLTKKSRGRRVPTSPVPSQVAEIAPDKPSERKPRKKNGRVYMCEVADCGKFFVRGEHLKRHVRSIHTHEKPFQCKHPGCSRYFNRHDNLLQHQKVHKDPSYVPASDNETQEVPPPTSSGPEFIPPLPPPPLSPTSHHHVFRSDSSIIMPNVTYNAFPTYVNGPLPTHEYVTNVAISDMRTAIPTSSHIHGQTHPESLRHDERFFQYGHPIGQPPMQISHHFTNNTNEHPGPIYFT